MEIYRCYKISQARNYLQKARKILEDAELLNHKVEGDFFTIDDFCAMHEMNIKEKNECRINYNN
jgi:hypothetical protein